MSAEQSISQEQIDKLYEQLQKDARSGGYYLNPDVEFTKSLAQGLLTDRYLDGIPADSRANKPHGFLKKHDIDEHRLAQMRALNAVAVERGQSLAQMALAWVLRDGRMTSALIGASRVEQIEQNVAALANLNFSVVELGRIDAILEQAA